ncbi:MAG TPA: hypothetical protein VFK05_22470, partial [Polyangiaceae bacterium]|nr:hypothetical protein [Polyangiaceae bacterium]
MLLRPDPAGRHPNWRARYADPDSGRMVKTTLDPTGLPTAEARRDWAIRKARSIAKRKMDLESGAHRATGTSLEDALKRYWEDHPKLRERTLEIYHRAAAKLQAWAKRAGIHSADDVRGPQLVAFRAELAREPRRVHALGGKRGQQRKTKDPRSASTIN